MTECNKLDPILIGIEDEGGRSPWHFPRNYKSCVEDYNYRETYTYSVPISTGISSFHCRIIERKEL